MSVTSAYNFFYEFNFDFMDFMYSVTDENTEANRLYKIELLKEEKQRVINEIENMEEISPDLKHKAFKKAAEYVDKPGQDYDTLDYVKKRVQSDSFSSHITPGLQDELNKIVLGFGDNYEGALKKGVAGAEYTPYIMIYMGPKSENLMNGYSVQIMVNKDGAKVVKRNEQIPQHVQRRLMTFIKKLQAQELPSIDGGGLSEGMMREALKLQHDKEQNRLVVVSDLEGKAANQETFKNKALLKANGFIWTGTHWAIPADKFEIAKKTLSTANKVEYIINSLEDVEEAVMAADADNKSLLKTKLDQYISDLANATDEAALSAEIRRYLTFFSKFHNYSFFNKILIYIQKPDATRVASFNTWKSKFRQVQKNTKGITILAPLISKQKDVADVDSSVDGNTLNNEKAIRGFKAVNVFDISDTKPIDERGEIPEEPKWWGENTPSETADKLYAAVVEVAKDMHINVTQDDAKRGEKGYSAGDHINISTGVSGAGRGHMTDEPDHRNPGEIYADGRDGYIYDQGYLDGLDQARFSVLKVVEMVDDNEITATQALEGVALGLARSMDILQANWAWTADLDPRDDEGDNDE
jgi:hypothetical protein